MDQQDYQDKVQKLAESKNKSLEQIIA